ncbi:MAG: DUF4097 family beta strand repeat-containing protein [Balneolaceae bacterium]|nr:DUF4097 family beta strand repeat-containing protein [Balneolaceae bacterium]
MKRTVLLFSLFCLALVPALTAQDTYTGETRDAIDGRGVQNFQVELGNGFTVVLRGSDTDSISYRYAFEGNRLAHERNFNRAEFRLERQGGTALLSIQFPELEDMRREANQSWLQRLFGSDIRNFNIEKQELVIDMPQDLALQLGTRYSNVDIRSVGRDLQVSTRSGKVTVADIGGNLSVSNEYGNTTARNVEGQAHINSRSADIVLENIGGQTQIISPYSNIDLSDIRGTVGVQNQSGTVEATGIRGTLQVRGDYSSMNIREVEGGVTVQSRSGELTIENVPQLAFAGEYTDITARNLTGTEPSSIENRSASMNVRNVTGSLQISGEYLEVNLEDIRGDLSVENRSGSVTADGVQRTTNIQGEYLEIDLNRFSGAVLGIHNRSGDVNVESTGSLSQVNIQVTYGDVQFTLNEKYSGHYNFYARYGELTVPNLFTSNGRGVEIPDKQEDVLTGSIGNSQSRFEIQTQNGDITITANY